MSLHLVPISEAVLKDAVTRWHRHNGTTFVGTMLRVGAATDDGTLVAVGCAGRPVARHYDDGYTLEVWRVASDGTHNATSMLYGALARAAFALGYWRIITYTQADESGASLRAAGWKVIAQRKARKGWSTPSRPRDDARYMTSQRTLWEASVHTVNITHAKAVNLGGFVGVGEPFTPSDWHTEECKQWITSRDIPENAPCICVDVKAAYERGIHGKHKHADAAYRDGRHDAAKALFPPSIINTPIRLDEQA